MIDEDCDPLRHVALAKATQHPLVQTCPLESPLKAAVDLCARYTDVHRLRAEVVEEVKALRDDLEPQLQAWLRDMPEDTRAALTSEGSTPLNPFLCFALLDAIHYPHAQVLFDDLKNGFDLAGNLKPGLGWAPTTAAQPRLGIEDFKQLNDDYIIKEHQRREPPMHWERMLQDILQDCQRGRMMGPFAAPEKWGFETSGVDDLTEHTTGEKRGLLPPPRDEDCYPSIAFPVEQYKADGSLGVRRCEDWKRSGSNALAVAEDKPPHHGIDTYVALARYIFSVCGVAPQTWGHDHEAAYRQLLGAPQWLLWVLLFTPAGPTLWKHLVLVFGAKGAVWAYNRIADAITHLARCLLWIPALHFVDDFGACEVRELAASGFLSFEALGGALGFQVKQEKKQEPAFETALQGVLFSTSPTEVTVAPTPRRRQKLADDALRILETGSYQRVRIRSFLGKAEFFNQSAFGRTGRALLSPLRARLGFVDEVNLSNEERDALQLISAFAAAAAPRSAPIAADCVQAPCLYSDAFFALGGAELKIVDLEGLRHREISKLHLADNGWGICIILEEGGYAARGRIPYSVMSACGTRAAYIFILEAIACCIGAWFFAPELGTAYWAFVDNTAAQFSLTKGTSKEPRVRLLAGLFWLAAASQSTAPWIERIPSKAQVADGPSRGDWAIADRLGLQRVELQLEEFWRLVEVWITSHRTPGEVELQALLECVQSTRRAAGLRCP